MVKRFRKKTPSEAANTHIRALLSEISCRIGIITDKELLATKRYFDNKCPYTGKSLRKGKCHQDHIEGQNRDSGGLDLYGNILICDKGANGSKSSKSYADFINSDRYILSTSTQEERELRIKKIDKFIQESGYLDRKAEVIKMVYDKFKKDYKEFLNHEYNLVYDRGAKLADALFDGKPIEK